MKLIITKDGDKQEYRDVLHFENNMRRSYIEIVYLITPGLKGLSKIYKEGITNIEMEEE